MHRDIPAVVRNKALAAGAARTVGHALACAARRIAAHDDERAVLVHGDVHQWNVLESADGFKLVDREGRECRLSAGWSG